MTDLYRGSVGKPSFAISPIVRADFRWCKHPAHLRDFCKHPATAGHDYRVVAFKGGRAEIYQRMNGLETFVRYARAGQEPESLDAAALNALEGARIEAVIQSRVAWEEMVRRAREQERRIRLEAERARLLERLAEIEEELR